MNVLARRATVKKINSITAVMLLSTAFLIDTIIFIIGILNFIPGGVIIAILITLVVNIFAYLTFITWFFLLKVSFLKKPSRFAYSAVALVIGFIPLFNMLPAWTLAVFLIILTTRNKQKDY